MPPTTPHVATAQPSSSAIFPRRRRRGSETPKKMPTAVKMPCHASVIGPIWTLGSNGMSIMASDDTKRRGWHGGRAQWRRGLLSERPLAGGPSRSHEGPSEEDPGAAHVPMPGTGPASPRRRVALVAWPLRVVTGLALVGGRESDEERLAEWRADELQPDGPST